MQKGKITDYESFQNEINILMNLVSELSLSLTSGACATAKSSDLC